MNFGIKRDWAVKHTIPVHSLETARLLELCCRIVRPHVSIEIGTAIGLGTALLAQTVSSRGGVVYSFEISSPSYQTAMSLFKSTNSTAIRSYRARFEHIPVSVIRESILPGPVQFAFIDGQKSAYDTYFSHCLALADTHACFVFDDIIQYASKTDGLTTLLDDADRHWTMYATERDDGCLIASPQQHIVAQCQEVLENEGYRSL